MVREFKKEGIEYCVLFCLRVSSLISDNKWAVYLTLSDLKQDLVRDMATRLLSLHR